MLLGGDATDGAVGVGAEDFDDVVGEVFGCDSAQPDGDDDGSVDAAQSYEPRLVGWPPAGTGRAVVDLDVYGCGRVRLEGHVGSFRMGVGGRGADKTGMSHSGRRASSD